MNSNNLSTIQKRHNLNEVIRMDEPGAGGACHEYLIQYRVFPVGEKEQVIPLVNLQFQHGARGEWGSTAGVCDQDLLEIVRDRLATFLSGDLPSRETACALKHIEEALMWLNKRAEDRYERGVLGTMQK